MTIHQPSRSLSSLTALDAVVYRSGRGIVRMRGADRLDLLHRLSTNAVRDLQPGEEGTTLLTSEKGRIVEQARVIVREDETLLVLAGRDAEKVRAWLDKYTIMDDVTTGDASGEYGVFLLSGDRLQSVLRAAFDLSLPAAGRWTSLPDDENVMVMRDARLNGIFGAMMVLPAESADHLEDRLTGAAAHLIDDEEYETLRIAAGIPGAGSELNESYNPLETGLMQYISWTKGCYIGQEVIARLDSYDKVQRHLVGLRLHTTPATLGDDVAVIEPEEGKRIGTLTSIARTTPDSAPIALGYVRTAYAVPGLELTVVPAEGAEGLGATVVKLPIEQ